MGFMKEPKYCVGEKTKKGVVMGTRAWSKVGINHWTQIFKTTSFKALVLTQCKDLIKFDV
jgi:hypothetical protein